MSANDFTQPLLNLPEDPLEREFRQGIKQPMAQFVIEVINVSPPSFVKTARGGYNVIEVAYKKDGKVEGKKLLDFTNPEVFNFVKGLTAGAQLSITSEKDPKNFWQWVSVRTATESDQQAADPQSSTAGAVTGGSTGDSTPNAGATTGRGKVTGSNYETPDERALRREFDRIKHRQIGRQGCINSAIAILTARGNQEPTVFNTDDVIVVAKELEKFVFDEVKS
jgi:hypothetical protein